MLGSEETNEEVSGGASALFFEMLCQSDFENGSYMKKRSWNYLRAGFIFRRRSNLVHALGGIYHRYFLLVLLTENESKIRYFPGKSFFRQLSITTYFI